MSTLNNGNGLTGMAKFRQARTQLLFNSIFWGSLSLKLRAVEMSCDELMRMTGGLTHVAATDGSAVYFGREWVDKTPLPQIRFVIAHEAMHCLLEDWYRQETRDYMQWAMACDYVINGVLARDDNMQMPIAGLHNERFNGKSKEEVYKLLSKNKRGGGGDSDSDNPDVSWNIGGVIRLRDESNPNVLAGEAQQIKVRNEWKIEAQKALEYIRKQGIGKFPAELERMIQEMNNPDRAIEDELREFMVRSIEGDFTMFPCSKLFVPYGLYLPTTRSEKIPPMVMVCDTSGSVDDRQIGIFEAKLNGVLYEYDTEVHVIYCDTHPYVGKVYTKHDLPVKLKPKGGGGTDYRRAFELVDKLDINPVCLIYLTDLYCDDYPSTPPDYPVLWGWLSNERKRKREMKWAERVPFGRVVFVKDDDE